METAFQCTEVESYEDYCYHISVPLLPKRTLPEGEGGEGGAGREKSWEITRGSTWGVMEECVCVLWGDICGSWRGVFGRCWGGTCILTLKEGAVSLPVTGQAQAWEAAPALQSAPPCSLSSSPGPDSGAGWRELAAAGEGPIRVQRQLFLSCNICSTKVPDIASYLKNLSGQRIKKEVMFGKNQTYSNP